MEQPLCVFKNSKGTYSVLTEDEARQALADNKLPESELESIRKWFSREKVKTNRTSFCVIC